MRVGFSLVLVGLALLGCKTDAQAERAPIAFQTDAGIHLSWRLLEEDPSAIRFNIYRQDPDGGEVKLTSSPLAKATSYIDRNAAPGSRWSVSAIIKGKERRSERWVNVANPQGEPYIPLPLANTPRAGAVGLGDLTGDGRMDYVFRTPEGSTDPYHRHWHPTDRAYDLVGVSAEGERLWTLSFGPGIERGVWYAPFLVYDLDQDGVAEVVMKESDRTQPPEALKDRTGRASKGPEYVAVYDGRTLEREARAPWPSREGFTGNPLTHEPYNRASRNQLAIAYLDGENPHLIVERGTYGLIKVDAYRLKGDQLVRVWRFRNNGDDAPDVKKATWGGGAHSIRAADLDGDGKDELVMGSFALDHDGALLWTTKRGHPDHVYVTDIAPDAPGLEVYYGMETGQRAGGMGVLAAATGDPLWLFDERTHHLHREGLCANLDLSRKGLECYSGEQADRSQRWLWSADGAVIGTQDLGGLDPLAVHWDADAARELISRTRILNYPELDLAGPELELDERTRVIAVADIVGDWREEIIVGAPGGPRVYVSPDVAKTRHPWLMQDPIYRNDVATSGMGYYQIPMLSRPIAP